MRHGGILSRCAGRIERIVRKKAEHGGTTARGDVIGHVDDATAECPDHRCDAATVGTTTSGTSVSDRTRSNTSAGQQFGTMRHQGPRVCYWYRSAMS
jgi:hypothetical protein